MTSRPSRTSVPLLLLAVLAMVALLGAACGSDSDDASTGDSSTTTATGDSSTTTAAGGGDDETAFVKDVQGQLQQIGCYEGEIDGDDGAETQAAILAFQEAEGLTADDEVGPQTEEALRAAVASGRHDVCAAGGGGGGGGGASTTTTAAGGGGASTTSTTRSGGGGGSTTSTTAGGGGGGGSVAPCTHDAIQAGLAQGETLHQWQCARTSTGQDYAGGTQSASGSSDRTDFILVAEGGAWKAYSGGCDAVPDRVKSYCEAAQG